MSPRGWDSGGTGPTCGTGGAAVNVAQLTMPFEDPLENTAIERIAAALTAEPRTHLDLAVIVFVHPVFAAKCLRDLFVRGRAIRHRLPPGSPVRYAYAAPRAPEPPPSGVRRLPMAERPRTRAECPEGPAPCPWFGCRHHIGLTVTARRVDVLPGYEPDDDEDAPWEPPGETCSLRVVEAHPDGVSAQAVAELVGLTRQRVEQIPIEIGKRAHVRMGVSR